MITHTEKKTLIQKILSFGMLMPLAKLGKVSFVIGSYAATFSFANALMPLSGLYFGLNGATCVTVCLMFLASLMRGGFAFHHLAFGIPNLFASYYWICRSWFFRFLIPFLCIILFLAHPIGAQSWPYALYWFIPLALYFKQPSSLFTTALGSTFTAHAVGSVIWLYTVPMAPSMWLALIPIVALERILFAIAMVVVHRIIQQLIHFWHVRSFIRISA